MRTPAIRPRGNHLRFLLLGLLTAYAAALLTHWRPFRDDVDLINIGDARENVLASFYMAHGWVAYKDYVNNHFPGIFTSLGPILRALGYGTIGTSPEIFARMSNVAAYYLAALQGSFL